MWLIIGASGKIGSVLTRLCQKKGVEHRLGVRDLDKARHSFGDEADLVHFDFSLPETYGPACEGIKKVFFIAPSREAPDQVSHLIREMLDQGVNQIVFSSGRTTGDIDGTPLNKVENQIIKSPIPYTILRPGWFMQNFLNWIGKTIPYDGQFYLPAGDAASAFVDVRDIAEVAFKILTDGISYNQRLELTSSEALTHKEVAKKITKELGKKVTYQSLESNDYIEKMDDMGLDRKSAQKMVYLYEIVRTGKEAIVSQDIELILGRPGRSFEDFLQDHRKELRERYLVQN